MPEHHTKNTTGVLAFCSSCNRRTLHSVSGKRIGPCMEHKPEGMTRDQERRAKERERDAANPKLF